MRVLAITFGDTSCASSLYRVFQYQRWLQKLGVELTIMTARDYSPAVPIEEFDLVLLQKKLFSLGRIGALRRRAKRLVYDLDDALWAPHGRAHHFLTTWRTVWRLKKTCRAADLCLAANDVLARRLQGWGARTVVFPMALDETIWTPRPGRGEGPLRIGWTGGPGNLKHLEAIEEPLLQVQTRHPEVEVAVHCGKRSNFAGGLRCAFLPYQSGQEAAVVRSFDIGLLPLSANEFAEGKSPIKGLQYMASAVAAVVSPLGATQAMFRDGETALFASRPDGWVEALERLVVDADLRGRLARQARQTFEARHALSALAPRLAELLRNA